MPLSNKTGSIIEDLVRPLLNASVEDGYTDEVILPYFKMAYDNLRMECEDNNIPFTNVTSAIIAVDQGVTDVGGPTGPALPTALVEIFDIYERIAGTDNDFMLMKRRYFLPKTSILTAYLEVWSFQKQYINFLGANGNIEIKIDYIADTLVGIIDSNTMVSLWNCRNFLGFRTAALCAQFIGENDTRAEALNAQAGWVTEANPNPSGELQRMLNISVKNQQSMPVRRKPFMSGYRQRGWAGYR